MSADIKEELSAEALKIVTGARRSAYGRPEQNFQRIARLWNAHLVNVGLLDESILRDPDAHGMRPGDVAAFMRLMKEARLAETPDHRDSYVDLIGYSLCGAEVAGVVSTGPAFDPIAAQLDAMAAQSEAWPPPGSIDRVSAPWRKEPKPLDLDAPIDMWGLEALPAVPEAKRPFKVRDRVRCVNDEGGGTYLVGDEGVLDQVSETGYPDKRQLVGFGCKGRMFDYRFELIEAVDEQKAEEAKPLQIEEGKFYRTRDGEKAGPAERRESEDYPWLVMVAGTLETFTDDGQLCRNHVDGDDLVAEWSE